MANTFTNRATSSLNTSLYSLYTVQSNITTIVHAIYISNKNSTDGNVDLVVNSGSNDYYICKNLDIPNNSTVVFEKPINLLSGNILKAKSSVAGSFDIFVSLLEIS